jgi:t-SNARE complex subunit (syntaxin)
MSPQFNSMNELTSYLDNMEKRVKTLEEQNDYLRSVIPEGEENATRALPDTNLLNHNFFKRAFTVWGHYFLAQLIISLVIIIILATLLLIPGLFSALTNFIQGLTVH